MMAVSIAETRSCWHSLQFVWCLGILCWFYLTVNKTGMGDHLKMVFTAKCSQHDRKFNLCVMPSRLEPNSVWFFCQESALEGKTIFIKMKRILQDDSKVFKHRLWYARAPLVRSAVSRLRDWSPCSRGEATKVSKPHSTWFFICEGIWRPWCNR